MVTGRRSKEVPYPTIKINIEAIRCVLLIMVDMTSNLSDFLKSGVFRDFGIFTNVKLDLNFI